MINSVIQVILSVFLIAIMAFISYSIYNNEMISSIVKNTTTKKQTKIFTGILDYTSQKNINIETYDSTKNSYININPSINQNGGAEYSYNFWIFFDVSPDNLINSSETSVSSNPKTKEYKYIVLFYKGEKYDLNKHLKLKDNTSSYDCSNNPIIKEFNDNNILIKNPLVKIRNDAKEIIVEYNNINYPETYNSTSIKINDCASIENAMRDRSQNKFGIKNINVDKYRQKFHMITIVFQEQGNNESIFNKDSANCKVYFNGVLIEDRLAHTGTLENSNIYNNIKSRVMKSNLSKLRINPDFNNPSLSKITVNANNKSHTISPLQVADLSYFNYALTLKDIKILYNNGYTNKEARFDSDINSSILYGKGKFIDEPSTPTVLPI